SAGLSPPRRNMPSNPRLPPSPLGVAGLSALLPPPKRDVSPPPDALADLSSLLPPKREVRPLNAPPLGVAGLSLPPPKRGVAGLSGSLLPPPRRDVRPPKRPPPLSLSSFLSSVLPPE